MSDRGGGKRREGKRRERRETGRDKGRGKREEIGRREAVKERWRRMRCKKLTKETPSRTLY